MRHTTFRFAPTPPPDALQPGPRRLGWAGLDRGLAAFAVAATADGMEVDRFQAPKPLARRLGQLRRCCRALSRAQLHSHNRAKVARRLSKEHARIADIRRSFLHGVSSQLVKTHDRLSLEHLTVANLVRNKHLARAIADAAGQNSPGRSSTSKRGMAGKSGSRTAATGAA